MIFGGSQAHSQDRLPYEVWILSIVGFLIAIGFGVMSPILPVYARTFGVTGFLIGLVVSALAILRLLTMPVSSWLVRRVGPRELATVGQLLIAFPTFMIGVSDSYWGILIWRGLSGFGSSMYGVSSMALLFAIVPPHMRGRANAISGGGFVLGGMAGPAIGGLIAAISIHAPFFFYSITLTISAFVMFIAMPRTDRQEKQQLRNTVIGLKDLVKDRRFRAATMMNFANGWQSNGVRNLLIPLFVVEVLHKTTSWTGLAFAIAAVAQACCLPLTGWGTDRLGRRFMLVLGGSITATMSIGIALTGSYALLVVLMCVYSVGASATGAASQALLADTVPISASSGLAAYQMAGDIGLILGPLVAGAVLDAFSMAWAWGLGAVLILIAVGLAWHTPRTVQPPVGGYQRG
ncbi:MAG: MFS transporter [Propionibacteriaceae bacterium]|nr:MFS transporter [Propionibacteriaceae bacterium]